ncbi:MAG: DUF2974 domain-containing protein [Acidobacteria bacterium]|nr:DUF2974 domain-containing protein [Acidobacteriota bacterium]
MGISIPNPIDGLKSVVHHAEDAGKAVVDTTVKATSTAVDFTEKAAVTTGRAAVQTFQFEASMTKFALQKSFDTAQTVGRTTAGLAGKVVDAVTHPGIANPPGAQGLKFSETKAACDIAYKRTNSKVGDVYQFPDGKQWKVVDLKEDPKTGFRAVALKPLDPADNRTIVAFSGTDEGKDWGDNVKQGLGLPTAQYREAVDFANKWKASDGNNVILTGHSLGGGLASYASIKTGLRATAVNSAPLALDHLGLNPLAARRITQYYVPGEALSVLNKANPLDIRPGVGIPVRGQDSILDPRSIGSNHSLDHVAPDVPLPKYLGNYN